jgi:hypothetical protein
MSFALAVSHEWVGDPTGEVILTTKDGKEAARASFVARTVGKATRVYVLLPSGADLSDIRGMQWLMRSPDEPFDGHIAWGDVRFEKPSAPPPSPEYRMARAKLPSGTDVPIPLGRMPARAARPAAGSPGVGVVAIVDKGTSRKGVGTLREVSGGREAQANAGAGGNRDYRLLGEMMNQGEFRAPSQGQAWSAALNVKQQENVGVLVHAKFNSGDQRVGLSEMFKDRNGHEVGVDLSKGPIVSFRYDPLKQTNRNSKSPWVGDKRTGRLVLVTSNPEGGYKQVAEVPFEVENTGEAVMVNVRLPQGKEYGDIRGMLVNFDSPDQPYEGYFSFGGWSMFGRRRERRTHISRHPSGIKQCGHIMKRQKRISRGPMSRWEIIPFLVSGTTTTCLFAERSPSNCIKRSQGLAPLSPASPPPLRLRPLLRP